MSGADSTLYLAEATQWRESRPRVVLSIRNAISIHGEYRKLIHTTIRFTEVIINGDLTPYTHTSPVA